MLRALQVNHNNLPSSSSKVLVGEGSNPPLRGLKTRRGTSPSTPAQQSFLIGNTQRNQIRNRPFVALLLQHTIAVRAVKMRGVAIA